MLKIAYHTLGCKVNQYDTQAMEELLVSAGYRTVPFPGEADVYLINTCTVTGTGDKKSLQLARRLKREHPQSKLILTGCLAQLKGSQLMQYGADLVVGTQFRSEIVSLLKRVITSGEPYCAVASLPENITYEPLYVHRFEDHTRAILKIQEGCRNRCTYCIIPAVRGPIRSRLPEDIRKEAQSLAAAGFREIVLTGIHLSSYGKDLSPASSLLDALQILEETDGILRIRLGSLEPGIATRVFAESLSKLTKICPQFHLALQSGSDSVLRRMRRQYLSASYLGAVANLREYFPHAAFTTDILTGFPGETEDEFRETLDFIRKVGFSRIHVFPYSPRPGTPAAAMGGQLSETVKQQRCRELIAAGRELSQCYQRQWIGRSAVLLPEEKTDGCWEGYTPEYLRIRLNPEAVCSAGVPVSVIIQDSTPLFLRGVINNSDNGGVVNG